MIVIVVVAAAIGKFGTDSLHSDSTKPAPNSDNSSLQGSAPPATTRSAFTAATLCKGSVKSLPNAKPYKPGERGIVASFVYDRDDLGKWANADTFLAVAPLRVGVSTDTPLKDVSLVLCRGRGALISKTTCKFGFGSTFTDVEITVWKRSVRLYRAQTGQLIGETEYTRSMAPCPTLITFTDSSLTDGINYYYTDDLTVGSTRLKKLMTQWLKP